MNMPLTRRQLKERLGNQKAFAEKIGKSHTTVNLVVNRKTQLLAKATVDEVRAAIAAEIGESVEEVFGSSAAAA